MQAYNSCVRAFSVSVCRYSFWQISVVLIYSRMNQGTRDARPAQSRTPRSPQSAVIRQRSTAAALRAVIDLSHCRAPRRAACV